MKHINRKLVLGLAAIAATATVHAAQTQPAPKPSFEVVSIKSTRPGTPARSIGTSPGRFIATGATLSLLIQYGYFMKDFQLSGGPDWVHSDRFDIDARFSGDVNPENDEKLVAMLQALLADRFKLKLHRETRQLPIYALTRAKGGDKLALSGERAQPQMRAARGQVSATHHSMPQLAGQLSLILGRKVLDNTGLTGVYDFTLQWTPDENQPGFPLRPDAPPADPNGPTIFTALTEQLGLKLESTKGPVDVLIIDSAQRPAWN